MASGSYLDEARSAALAFGDSLLGLARPRLRIGVTGLSRSGKTVFTTALIQNLVEGARLPVLKASAEGRIARVRLVPQPDPDIPRFPYEAHRAALSGPDRRWPDSTRRISELRIEIDYERGQMDLHHVRHQLRDGTWAPIHDGTESFADGPMPPEELVAAELNAFLRAVETRQAPAADAGAAGVTMARIVEAIHESASRGEPMGITYAADRAAP